MRPHVKAWAANIAGFLVVLATVSPAAAQTYGWQFEAVHTASNVCTGAIGVGVDRDGRVGVLWTDRCFDDWMTHSNDDTGFRWAVRTPDAGAWTTHAIIDRTCNTSVNGSCPGIRGIPAFAFRPADGTPFLFYAQMQNDGIGGSRYETLRADLASDPTGQTGVGTGDVLAQDEVTLVNSVYQASFASDAAGDATPNYARRSPQTVALNGNSIAIGAIDSANFAYASGIGGRHHIVFFGNLGTGDHYYYSNGTLTGTVPIPLTRTLSRSGGIGVAVDAIGHLHVAIAARPDDPGATSGGLTYLMFDGSTWQQVDLETELGAGGRSIAVDSAGHPAIVYRRASPAEIRLKQYDGFAWHDALVSLVAPEFTPGATLAFDRQDRPYVFFHDRNTSSVTLAIGTAIAGSTAVVVSLAGTGSGTVAGTPGSIACPGKCIADVPPNAYVTLTATPAAGSVFSGWQGACSGTGPCIVAVNGPTSVTAVFNLFAPRRQITVTTHAQFGGPGECSLGDAIRASNLDQPVNGCPAGSGPDRIIVPGGEPYLLTEIVAVSTDRGPSGLPWINSDIEIDGDGPGATVIERSLGAPDFKIFGVEFGTAPQVGRLTLNGVTVRRGSGEGAGVYMSSGPVTINDSAFEENHSDGINTYGGAISNRNAQTLSIARTTFVDNRGGTGGAIYSSGPTTIVNSSFTANVSKYAGGALGLSGATTIAASQFAGNIAAFSGGAVANYGTATIAASRFEGNSVGEGVGGGVGNFGTLRLIDSTLINNKVANGSGGGLGNDQGTAIVTGTTIAWNEARNAAGGVYANGNTTLTNTTISGNRAGRSDDVPPTLSRGGGILNGSFLTLNAVTITANLAAPGNASGLYNGNVVTIGNTILSGNTFNPGDIDCWSDTGALHSLGHNLAGTAANCLLNAGPGDQVLVDAMLGPLANNGGSTMTHALLAGSPAIDAGDPAEPGTGGSTCPAGDQRNVPRPQGLACDIGAFEVAGEFGLTIDRTGVDGSITSNDGLIDCDQPQCTAEYEYGTSVILRATAGERSTFVAFEGCDSTSGDTCTVTIDAARRITAIFRSVRLTVVTTSGGTITSSPAGISCPGVCSAEFAEGTVTLTGTPDAGLGRGVWSGACAGLNFAQTPTCVVNLTAATAVGATFIAPNIVTVVGSGDITVAELPEVGACSTTCGYGLTMDATFTLVATPRADYTFSGWGDAPCDNIAGNTCTLTVRGPIDYTAQFTQLTANLSVHLTARQETSVAGLPLTYDFSLVNLGPDQATGVVLKLIFGNGATIQSYSSPCVPAGATLRCDIGALAKGAHLDSTVVAIPGTAGVLVSTLRVTQDESDPNVDDDVSTALTQVLPAIVTVSVDETINVADTVVITPSILIAVLENVAVLDDVVPLPSMMLEVMETVHRAG